MVLSAYNHVLSAHSFASNWQLLFLNQKKGENDGRKYFMINLNERIAQDQRIEPTTSGSQVGWASDGASQPVLAQSDINHVLAWKKKEKKGNW